MREILFRGKRVDNGKWVYGYLSKYTIKHHEELTHYPYISFIDKDLGFYVGANVIPETVGQYTGLKDKNGVEIYEGDICWDSDWGSTFKVFWCEDSLAWKVAFISDGDTEFLQECVFDNEQKQVANTAEVIGNIHDNPELLKGGAE